MEIKRILEQHRPTLLRSLKKLRRRKDKSAELEDEGQGTTGMAITICDLDSNESYPGRFENRILLIHCLSISNN